VAQIGYVEVVIAGKEGWAAQSMQERNNFTAILHSRSSNLCANLPEVDLP
jgi:hypothetical protein